MIKSRPFISSTLCSTGIDHRSFYCINHDLSCRPTPFTTTLLPSDPRAQSKFNLCNCTNVSVVGNDAISTVPEAPDPHHNSGG